MQSWGHQTSINQLSGWFPNKWYKPSASDLKMGATNTDSICPLGIVAPDFHATEAENSPEPDGESVAPTNMI